MITNEVGLALAQFGRKKMLPDKSLSCIITSHSLGEVIFSLQCRTRISPALLFAFGELVPEHSSIYRYFPTSQN